METCLTEKAYTKTFQNDSTIKQVLVLPVDEVICHLSETAFVTKCLSCPTLRFRPHRNWKIGDNTTARQRNANGLQLACSWHEAIGMNLFRSI